MSAALLLAVALVTQSVSAAPQETLKKLDPHLAEKISVWLSNGPHQDMPWHVRVHKAVFTFQQRNLVTVTAEIDAKALQQVSVRRDLVFIIKVADEHGTWLPGDNHVFEQLQKPVTGSTELTSQVLLQPGKYTVASILYESVLDQYDLSLNSVIVDALKKDPLPSVSKDAPVAEFIRDGIYGSEVFSPLRTDLPLKNKRSVQIDLIVDTSTRENQVALAPPPAFLSPRFGLPHPSRFKRLNDKSYMTHLLESASVLSSLRPQTGCIRVSAFDLMKKHLFEPAFAQGLDWQDFSTRQVESTKNKISVNALEDRKGLSKYFVESFQHFIEDAHCAANADHIVILLSHGLHFPEGTHGVKAGICGCKVYYMRQNDTAIDSDDLKKVLAPLSPQEFEFHDPVGFRKSLAELIQRIESVTQ